MSSIYLSITVMIKKYIFVIESTVQYPLYSVCLDNITVHN